MDVQLNNDKRLFVIKTRGGYSCWGYDNCYRETKQLAEILNFPYLMPKEEEIGTLTQYEQHRKLLGLIGTKDLGTWFDPRTPQEVRNILEKARISKTRLKIWYGDSDTGISWSSKPEIGTVGRSMGPLKIPLLIKTRVSSGGEAILDHSIVKIENSATKSLLWEHPDFARADELQTPSMSR